MTTPQQIAAEPYAAARALWEALVRRLEGVEAAGLEHSALEELLEAAGRQLRCQLLQDHLGLRAPHQRRSAAPLLAEDGLATPRQHLERG